MKLRNILAAISATMLVGFAATSQAGVAKVLRVDNNLDSDLTVFVDGVQVGIAKSGEVATFDLPPTADASQPMQLLGTEADGGVYQLQVVEAHPNGFTWGVYEGDGEG